MIWKTEMMAAVRAEGLAGGVGGAGCVRPLTRDNPIAGSRLQMVGRISLDPGASVGEHGHEQNEEVYIIEAGQGEYCDNGPWLPVGPGDIAVCLQGQRHALRNSGDEPLTFYGLIIG